MSNPLIGQSFLYQKTSQRIVEVHLILQHLKHTIKRWLVVVSFIGWIEHEGKNLSQSEPEKDGSCLCWTTQQQVFHRLSEEDE